MSQLELIEEIAEYTFDPLGCVETIFPWGEGELEKSTGPRTWQANILSAIGSHLQNEATRYQPLLIAVASGHDIGKSALVGMVTKWALSTCEDSRVMITANTGNQLISKTQPEVSKWFRMAEDKDLWETKVTRIDVRDPAHKANWRADFETWSERNTEAFQGLHNIGKRILIIFDEASGIPDLIWEVTEGVLADADTEIIWLAFGNPTKNTGRFRECFGKFAHRWKTFQIDSRTVEGTNKEQLDRQVADYGEDSDIVRVRIRGVFPRAGSSQFIASDIVALARKYRAESFSALPKILSVDVARFGDDQTVIGTRQGRKARILVRLRGQDTVQVAERTIEFIHSEKPDATVVDGDGLGAGVVDQIKFRGFGDRLFEFHGGATANDSAAYYNRSAECWGAMRDWLAAGAEIPDDNELEANLTGREYGFTNKSQIQLERKEDMKARGLMSPDDADMLSMTFAVNVLPKPKEEPRPMYSNTMSNNWMQG
jgi:hypothetical protein